MAIVFLLYNDDFFTFFGFTIQAGVIFEV